MVQATLFNQGVSDDQPVSSEPVVIVEHATASYGTHRVLEDISLSLVPGEIYVLLGPNGAGKSSLVRLLTGSLQPQAGSVRILTGSSGLSGTNRQTLSLVPQDIALYPWLTAMENCWAFGRASGLRRQDAIAQANRMLKITGCETVAATLAGHLSGGYKRRVNIAAALVNHPRLLILDEPTVGVDLSAKQAINATVKALGDTGIAILLITHDFETADTLASRVGFLKKGKLVCEGVPSKLIKAEFGDSKQIEIYISDSPSPEQVAVLRAQGAHPAGSPTMWHLFKPLLHWDGSNVLSSLEEKGVVVRELRLRDPGLETLYNLYCDENQDV
jgi:ABC-2 type transport system ATP-binding protein